MIQHPVRREQGVTSVCVTSLGFLEAGPLVGEAGGGVELSRIMHRLPHPRDFASSRLCHFPPPPSLVPFSFSKGLDPDLVSLAGTLETESEVYHILEHSRQSLHKLNVVLARSSHVESIDLTR